jgi:hypothetical protein
MTVAVCSPTDRITKSLLGYGILAGPFYVVVSLAQALTRNGFDLRRHEWSLLANGPLGWIQMTNLVVTGLMTVAAAIGMRRALRVLGGRVGGVGHHVAGGVGFLGLVAGALLMTRYYARQHRRGMAWFSAVTGVGFLASFVGIASGAVNPAVLLGFWVGVVLVWSWLAITSIDLYRRTPLLTPVH